MKLGLSAAAVMMVALSACASAPRPLPGQAITASANGQPSARKKRVRELLAEGDLAGAKAEMQALASEQPGDREVIVLQSVIDVDPRTLLGALYFDINAKPGDTFEGLAERYLHNRDLAYALARYNSATPPTQPAAGQIVHIPGSEQDALRQAPPTPRRERPGAEGASSSRGESKAGVGRPAAEKAATEKAAAEKAATEKAAAETPPPPPPPPKPPAEKPPVEKPAEPPAPPKPAVPAEASKPAPPPHDPAKAATLRSEALLLMNKGDLDHAVGLLRQAAALDPDSAPIKADLERAVRIQHGAK